MPRYYIAPPGRAGTWVLADTIETVQAWAALQDIPNNSVVLSQHQNPNLVLYEIDLRACTLLPKEVSDA